MRTVDAAKRTTQSAQRSVAAAAAGAPVLGRVPGKGGDGGIRARAPTSLGASELAELLLAVCELSGQVRARGACIGGSLLTRLSLGLEGGGRYARSSPGSRVLEISLLAPASRRERYAELAGAVAHARNGHDAGCRGLGVSLASLEQLAEAWGRDGERAYVLDGFYAAANELAGHELWGVEAGADVVRHEVGARITPETPTRDALRSLTLRRRRTRARR